MELPPIFVTHQDTERLSRLLDVLPERHEAARALDTELARATVVASTAVPHDVVTMNSRVLFEELDSGKRSEVVLVYPHEADLEAMRVSVLSAVGTALLGMRVGQSIAWELPSGKVGRYRVLDIVYQPEAAGDFHL